MAVDDTLFCFFLLSVTVLSFFVDEANQYIPLVSLRWVRYENKISRKQGHI